MAQLCGFLVGIAASGKDSRDAGSALTPLQARVFIVPGAESMLDR